MTAKYLQIAREIKNASSASSILPARRYPTSLRWRRSSNTSRMTIQQAMRQLIVEGLIYAGAGHALLRTAIQLSRWGCPVATISAPPKPGEHLGQVQSEVVRFEVRFPTDKEQSSLLIDADAPVYDFVRLRLLNGEPVSLDLTVMPVGLMPGLTKSHLEGSVFRYVQETLGLKLMGSYRVVRAMKPDELDKQHLHCSTDPVLEVEQVIYLEDSAPLEYAHCHYRYDHGGIILVNNG